MGGSRTNEAKAPDYGGYGMWGRSSGKAEPFTSTTEYLGQAAAPYQQGAMRRMSTAPLGVGYTPGWQYQQWNAPALANSGIYQTLTPQGADPFQVWYPEPNLQSIANFENYAPFSQGSWQNTTTEPSTKIPTTTTKNSYYERYRTR